VKAALVGLLLVGSVACASASPPRGFPMAVSDTARVSVTCPAAGANSGCIVSVADSVSGAVVWANQPMTIGQTLTAILNGVPGQRVVVKGTMVGVAPNVPNSAPVFARAEGVFPFPDAQVPTFQIILTFPARP